MIDKKYYNLARRIARFNATTLEELNGASRKSPLPTLRAYIAFRLYEAGCKKLHIGKVINRDHSTVIHMIQNAEGYIEYHDALFMNIKENTEEKEKLYRYDKMPIHDITLTEKKCSDCGKVFPITEFHKNRWNSNGIQAYCKECGKKRWRERHVQRHI